MVLCGANGNGHDWAQFLAGEFERRRLVALDAQDVFRHQCITFLTKTSGLADAELQLITGHAKRETLAIYQHAAVDGQVADKYQVAMKEVGL